MFGRPARALVVIGSLVVCTLFAVVGQASASAADADHVSVATARQVALRYVTEYSCLISAWEGATVGAPLIYYSDDESPSAYEFAVTNQGTDAGYMLIAARKDWMPVLEFGAGRAPSSRAEPARKRAVAAGLVSNSAEVQPAFCYAGAGMYSVKFSGESGKDVIIDLVDGVLRAKSDTAQLQMEADEARARWAKLLGGFGASAPGESSTWIDTIADLTGFEFADVMGSMPAWWESGDGASELHGDDGWADGASYPSCVGKDKPDPWSDWDGCTAISGAMILGYWWTRGYDRFPGFDQGDPNDTDAAEILIDLMHWKLGTDDHGNTGPFEADNGIRDVAAMTEGEYQFGYDFKTESRYAATAYPPDWFWPLVVSETEASRPLVLGFYDRRNTLVPESEYEYLEPIPGSNACYWHYNPQDRTDPTQLQRELRPGVRPGGPG